MTTSFWMQRCRTGLAALAMSLLALPTLTNKPITAAADLRFALDEVAQSFKRDTGQSVKLTFGSSGTLATQIRNGAPFQWYLSANEDYVFKLHADGFTHDQGELYAIGHIVLMALPSSSLPVDGELKGLATLLNAGQIKRFAIANPEHGPYGRRAEEVLKRAGLWETIQPKLVLRKNVSQAVQFAISGSAEGGVIALSLAKLPQMAQLGRYAVIPSEGHEPLRLAEELRLQPNASTDVVIREDRLHVLLPDPGVRI